MTIGLLTNIVSPHQLPLAKAVSQWIGADNYRYFYTESFHAERAKMGWGCDVSDLKFQVSTFDGEGRKWLENADLVYCEEREFDLLESRLKAGKKTFYVSERWFKPINLGVGHRCRCSIPGWVRLVVPSYFKMAKRFVKLFDYPDFRYLPQGKWAERDMALLCRMMGRKMPKDKVIQWGYFVAPSTFKKDDKIHCPPPPSTSTYSRPLRVLWVGRMIGWKRVDTIIRAVLHVNKEMAKIHSKTTTSNYNPITLTLVGTGDKRAELEKLAAGAKNIVFKNNLPIEEIRTEMRANDVYVLASTGEEGWGAALNEAMEEGMLVLGTFEAGSSSYMLPDSHKFHAGAWRRLATLLKQAADGKLSRISIGNWTAAKAAERLVEMAK